MTKNDRELGERARHLVRAVDRGSLATIMRDDASPYASLVMLATDFSGNPLLLISDLAEHTQNIQIDRRCSLLIDGTVGLETPLTGSRITLNGILEKYTEKQAMERYIRRHQDAEMYAGFDDFSLYCMTVERVHMVAGFGEIHWISSDAYYFDASETDELAAAEGRIVSHMNDDHKDAIRAYATALLDQQAGEWQMTGIDPEGCDLRFAENVARLGFDRIICNADQARSELVKLAKKSRKTAEK